MKKIVLFLIAISVAMNVNAQKKILSNYTGKSAKNIENNKVESQSTSAIAGKPIVKNKKSVLKSNITDITLGTSANAFSIYGNRTYLWADNNINSISFVHRAAATPGSGYLQYDLSTDGGTTWSVNKGPVFSPDNTTYFAARYPQGGIYNPVGNTSPNNAYFNYFAPALSGTNQSWGGICYGSHKIDGSVAATKNEIESSVTNRIYHMIPDAFHICQTGEAWMAEWNDSSNTSNIQLNINNEMNLYKGVWNSSTGQYDYTRSAIQIPMTGAPTNPLQKKVVDQKIAFAPNGQIGYIAIIGHNSYTFMPDSVYYPILYKTTDGGANWVGPINVDLSNISELQQALFPDSNYLYSSGFELDLAVDHDGNPYLAMDVCIAAGGWAITTDPGKIVSAVVFSTDGGTVWDAKVLDYIQTFRGTFAAGTANEIHEDNRNQISTNMSGTKMFMTWLDTDTLLYGSADENFYPDIRLRALDITSGSLSPVYNVTTGTLADGCAYMGSASYYIFENSGTYEIPLVYMSMDPTNSTTAVTYHYLKGYTISNGVFSNVSPAGTISGATSVCKGQTSVTYTVPAISGADSYIWTLPGGATGSSSTNSITVDYGSSAVSGNITVYGHNITGDGTSSSLYITVYSIPSAPTVGNNGPVCEGTSLTLSASSISSASYLWTGPNGYTSTMQNPTVSSYATQAMAGTYNVTASVHSCVSPSASTTVAVKTKPSAPVAGSNSPVCKGTTLALTASNVTGATYSWTGPGNYASTQQNPIVSASATSQMSGNYYVKSLIDGCYSTAASTNVYVNATAPTENICYVEFDTTTHKNKINWTSALPINVDSVNIYNEISTGVWSKIGSVPVTQPYFIDVNSNPFSQSYSYKISSIDTCRNESALSLFHTTVTLLAAYDQPTNTYGFTWSAYEGLTVPNYFIYGLNSNGFATQIGSVPGNQYFYNYLNPDVSYIKYFVGFNASACGSKTDYLVKSNWVQATTGISEISGIDKMISIYPNPIKNKLVIQTELKVEKIEILDIIGNRMYKGIQKNIDCSDYASGIYIIKIYTEKGISRKKFIKD